MKKLSQFLKVHISEMPGTIYLKFRMWGTDGTGHLHSKKITQFCTSSMKCVIVLPVKILMGMACRLLGLHDTLLCVLIRQGPNFSLNVHTTMQITYLVKW